jgi:hypothetical protein
MLYEMAPYTLFGMFAAGVVHELLGKFKQFSTSLYSLFLYAHAGLFLLLLV